ncbi:MAG: hypothetical protein AAAC47_09010, partial [Pararhizobium sp.]
RQIDVLQHLLGAVGLIQPGHMIDELTCHKETAPTEWDFARYVGELSRRSNEETGFKSAVH